MKRAEDVYAKGDGCWYDYQPMLNEFGDIVIQEDQDDYQGDSFLIYKVDDRYGYLNFGWGSCSGCDALQACNNINEVQKLMDELYDSIQWFDSLAELKIYFADTDWWLKHEYYLDEFKTFLERVKEL